MSGQYLPKQYWERRLAAHFNLQGVGHQMYSERYNAWLYSRNEVCLKSIFKKIPLAGKRVLDIGCGTGFFLNWYLEQGAVVSGIDLTDVSIQKLRQRFNCDLQTRDITDSEYPIPAKKFDVVSFWGVIYHIVDDGAFRRALDNVRDSITEGGLLLLTDFLGQPNDIQTADHVRARSLATYKKALGARGFELTSIRPLYTTLNTPHFARLDNRLGWLYFFLDNLSTAIPQHNLSVSVWTYRG
jgi:SAM-dependent methyltransferase